MQSSWSPGLRVPVSPWRDGGLPQVPHVTLTDRVVIEHRRASVGALLRHHCVEVRSPPDPPYSIGQPGASSLCSAGNRRHRRRNGSRRSDASAPTPCQSDGKFALMNLRTEPRNSATSGRRRSRGTDGASLVLAMPHGNSLILCTSTDRSVMVSTCPSNSAQRHTAPHVVSARTHLLPDL